MGSATGGTGRAEFRGAVSCARGTWQTFHDPHATASDGSTRAMDVLVYADTEQELAVVARRATEGEDAEKIHVQAQSGMREDDVHTFYAGEFTDAALAFGSALAVWKLVLWQDMERRGKVLQRD